jgi:hypothetical protein
MRYVIVDPEGSSRAYFGSLREVREWMRALKAQDPDLLDELVLMTYDAMGREVANQWLSDFFPEIGAIVATLALEIAPVGSLINDDPALSAGWYGTATSTSPVFRRQCMPASDTRSSALAEMAVG